MTILTCGCIVCCLIVFFIWGYSWLWIHCSEKSCQMLTNHLIFLNLDDSFFSSSSSITFPLPAKTGNDRGNLLGHQEDKVYLQKPSQPPIK